ncbi:MAG: LuxR family transcriptional regulator, partial [Labilithrix sp.]|nr:LuxR family transcriptional regulator [Labilithrix sp.]
GEAEGIECVGEGASLRDALALVADKHPDILLLDLRLPDGRATDAIAALCAARPGLRVVFLTGLGVAADAHEALRRGASGYLTKDGVIETIVDAVKAVSEGAIVVAPEVRAELLERVRQPSLTERELEVLALVVEGYTNPEIGEMLGVSAGTVRTHVGHILAKLGAAARTEATSVALRHGLV